MRRAVAALSAPAILSVATPCVSDEPSLTHGSVTEATSEHELNVGYHVMIPCALPAAASSTSTTTEPAR